MLKTRIVTAVVLLLLLTALLLSHSMPAVVLTAGLFFAAAAWEALRLFNSRNPVLIAMVWTAAFSLIVTQHAYASATVLTVLCVLIWALRLIPSLRFGLPALEGRANKFLSGIYGVAILGCFTSILAFYMHSPLYLCSVMAIIWVADVGAYFSGKAFGRHKLAPAISPGKSWEGVIGGWVAVLVLAAISTRVPILQDTFVVQLQHSRGWVGVLLALSLLVAASVCGDLFESQLKRRAGAKDSSTLLPGHGGVLDRIDALLPSLPLALLIEAWR